MRIYNFLLLFSIFLGVMAQLFLKLGMKKANIQSISKLGVIRLFKKIFCNVPVIFGFLAYGVSTIVWIVVLSELDLSYAYPIMSLSYVIVAFASKIFFKEKITSKRWISIVIITVGVVLVGLS
jgi:multidrug transporter EmrE-like cation transporter